MRAVIQSMWRAAMVLAAGALAAISLPAMAQAAAPRHVEVQAHRGGPYVEGRPAFPENTMPAFRHAAHAGFVLELDARLTRDDVPVLLHDATLDRTTTCTGLLRALTAAELAAHCRSDVLGVPGNASGLPTAPVIAPTVPVPTLAELLAFASESRSRVNVEIKGLPSDPGSDAAESPGYAARILDAVDASGIPRSRVVIQSFWPPHLDVAEGRGFDTSLLSLAQTSAGAPENARARGYEWVSPAWPFAPAHVSRAQALGLRVAPYTLDRKEALRAAAAVGVDGVISDDPVRAARILAGFFAMQLQQEIRDARSYVKYRRRIERIIRRYALPRRR